MNIKHECRYCDSKVVDVSYSCQSGKYHVCCWHCLREGANADTEKEAIELFDNPAFLYGKRNNKSINQKEEYACLFKVWKNSIFNPCFLGLYGVMFLAFGLPLVVLCFASLYLPSLNDLYPLLGAWLFVFLFDNLIFFSALNNGMCDKDLTESYRENQSDQQLTQGERV